MPTLTKMHSPGPSVRALLPDDRGRLPRFLPDRWHGQEDCAVGPFPGRTAAERFAHRLVDFGLFDVFTRRIFAFRDGWFVEVRPLGADG